MDEINDATATEQLIFYGTDSVFHNNEYLITLLRQNATTIRETICS